MKFSLSRHVAVGVKDMKAAEEFYTDVMGWEVGERGDSWVELHSGTITLYICDDNDGVCFDIPTDSVPATYAYLKERGCKLVRETKGEMFIRDPFGVEYCLSQGGFEP
jgi:catechol 2,3-dioxygenase-like lactoylglutathione lyase family enzyme